MATPGRSQALREVSQYLGVRGSDRALRLEERAYRSLFGRYGRDNWRYWAISPFRDMLAIRLVWGRDDVLENLRIAMLLEAVGQGPQRYCICFDDSDEDFSDDHPEYYRRLQLVLYALPQERMFIYPAGGTLRGPFLHEPWLSRARAIQSRPSITDEEFTASFVPGGGVSC